MSHKFPTSGALPNTREVRKLAKKRDLMGATTSGWSAYEVHGFRDAATLIDGINLDKSRRATPA